MKKEINAKVLAKKLKALKQDIIRDCVCNECGKSIVYIQVGHGSASVMCHYEKFEPEEITICTQVGHYQDGYKIHICKSKAVAEE